MSHINIKQVYGKDVVKGILTNKGNKVDAQFKVEDQPIISNCIFISEHEAEIAAMIAKHSHDQNEWTWKFKAILRILDIESAWS